MPHTNPILQQSERASAVTSTTPAAPAAELPAVASSEKLLAVQSALEQSTTRTSLFIDELAKGAGETKVASDAILSAIEDVTTATQIISLTEDTVDMQAQNATIAAFDKAGGTETQTALMAALKEDSERVDVLLDEKADIIDDEFTGIQLIDNIINELRSVQTDAKINLAIDQRVSTMNQIQNITTATESFSRAATITKETINKGTIAANLTTIGAKGTIQAAEVTIANINANADAMARVLNADSRNVASLIQSFRLDNEVEQMQITREKHQLQREQMEIARKQMELALPAAEVALEQAKFNLAKSQKLGPTQIASAELALKDAQTRIDNALAVEAERAVSVQKAQSMIGLPVETPETISVRALNPITRERYALLQDMGGVDDIVIGQTPAEAKEALQILAPQGDIIQTPALRTLDTITSLQLQAYADSKDGIPKDPEVVKNDFNNTAKVFMDTAAANISTGDESNPYHSIPLGVLATTMEAIKSDPFYKKVLEPMAMKEMNPERILDAGVAAIRSNLVSVEQVAEGIETIFDSAAAYNNTLSGGFRRVGLPNQTTYNVQFKRPTSVSETLKLLGTTVQTLPAKVVGADTLGISTAFLSSLNDPFMKVDLMDPMRVKEAIVKFLSASPPKADTTLPVDNKDQGAEQ